MSNLDYITKQGYVKLRQRLDFLNNTERPDIIKQVVTAREMGDLSENAEYHAAREKQRQIDKEITHLKNRFNKLQVIDPSTMPKDAVRFGAVVRVKEAEKVMNYRVVGVDEAEFLDDVEIKPISIASPIGRSLLGSKPGQTVIVKVPRGNIELHVIEIVK